MLYENKHNLRVYGILFSSMVLRFFFLEPVTDKLPFFKYGAPVWFLFRTRHRKMTFFQVWCSGWVFVRTRHQQIVFFQVWCSGWVFSEPVTEK